MKPYTGFNYAFINKNGDVQIDVQKRSGGSHPVIVKSKEDLVAVGQYIEDNGLMSRITCSSSLDFPEDEGTTNSVTLAMCDLIRNGE